MSFEFEIPEDLQEVAGDMTEDELRYTTMLCLGEIAKRNNAKLVDIAEGLLAALMIRDSVKDQEARMN